MKSLSFTGLPKLVSISATEEKCRTYLEELIWNGKPFCAHCKSEKKIYRYADNKRFKCSECKKQFTITKGTIFEYSKIPLTKWFLVLYLFSSHKKGISSKQIARDFGITQPNSWNMLHRIRLAMNNNKQFQGILEGIVEIDEAFVGGRNANKHYDKRQKGIQGRSTKHKAPVLGLLQRGGNVFTFPVKRLPKKGIQALIRHKVKSGSTISTDEYRGYTGLNKKFNHITCNHGASQYCNGLAHTNTIEGFWSWVKKGLKGIYHSTSRKFLFMYLDEYEFRYNTRKFSEFDRFDLLLRQFVNNRLFLKSI